MHTKVCKYVFCYLDFFLFFICIVLHLMNNNILWK